MESYELMEHLQYVDETVPPRSNPLWFTRASVNWAENQLRHAKTHPDDIAVIDTTEHSPSEGYTPAPRHITQRELLNLVGQVQRGLKAAGVKKGHRVCYWGGNRVVSEGKLKPTDVPRNPSLSSWRPTLSAPSSPLPLPTLVWTA